MIMARLKESTSIAHERAERLLPSLDALATRQGYARFLGAMHGFYRSWEPVVWDSVRDAVPEIDSSARRKLPALERDLAALGIESLVHSAPAAPSPSLPGVAESLGALYVFEGATLGGQVIVRRMTRDAADGALPRAFVSGYGEHTGEMWRAFGEALTRWVSENGKEEQIVDGALRCFTALSEWLSTSGRRTGLLAADEASRA